MQKKWQNHKMSISQALMDQKIWASHRQGRLTLGGVGSPGELCNGRERGLVVLNTLSRTGIISCASLCDASSTVQPQLESPWRSLQNNWKLNLASNLENMKNSKRQNEEVINQIKVLQHPEDKQHNRGDINDRDSQDIGASGMCRPC